jgi:hypothetical protein
VASIFSKVVGYLYGIYWLGVFGLANIIYWLGYRRLLNWLGYRYVYKYVYRICLPARREMRLKNERVRVRVLVSQLVERCV